ncbi:unnamed protein product [Sphagnum jensenii]|uniref:Uncharacterized protein n=1 Tax=Sphagnum jensenii TaxID=128206 RepID=A0ABP0VF65_9BRYO
MNLSVLALVAVIQLPAYADSATKLSAQDFVGIYQTQCSESTAQKISISISGDSADQQLTVTNLAPLPGVTNDPTMYTYTKINQGQQVPTTYSSPASYNFDNELETYTTENAIVQVSSDRFVGHMSIFPLAGRDLNTQSLVFQDAQHTQLAVMDSSCQIFVTDLSDNCPTSVDAALKVKPRCIYEKISGN